ALMPSEDLFAERLRKVEELAARGVSAYGVDFRPTATMTRARALLEVHEREHPPEVGEPVDGPEVAVAGRVMQLRRQGRVCVGQRYRKRSLALQGSEAQRRHFATRTAAIRALRASLDARGFMEVETPILQPIAGGGAAVPFVAHWNALHTDVYLRIAIELHLK